MKEHFGPDDQGLAYLSKTAAMPWDEFWVPGGSLRPRAEIEPGLFEISQVVIGREARLWISAEGVDTGINDEVFFLTFMRDERFGEELYEVKWRPRRARLTKFPATLPLERFASGTRQYELVSIWRDATVKGAYETVEVDAGLIVTNTAGDRLLFTADQNTPLDMHVTMRDSHIDAYLRGAVDTRPIVAREA